MTSGVYAFENTVTGRCYVGSSIDLTRRERTHRRMLRNGTSKCLKLQNSWAKHGETAFEFVVLELTSADEAPLRAAEQVWIDRLDAASEGYNINPVAGNVGRLPKTEAHRRNIGEGRRGHTHSEATKAVLSDRAKARDPRPTTEDTKAKISKANSGKTRSAEQRKRISIARSGLKLGPMTEAHKQAIRDGRAAARARKEAANAR